MTILPHRRLVERAGRLVRAAVVCAVTAGLAGVNTAAAQEADATPALTPELLKPFKFRFIGPSNMSGRITSIAVPDTRGRKTIYVGLASGGVWKTTNRGVTWKPIFNDEKFAAVADVTVAPSDPKIVWVGTGERNSLRSNGWGDGVYRSTDGGNTWEHMGLEETREIGRIVIHPDDPNTVYVAAMGHLWGANPERGVYRTTDGGETWEKILFVNDTTGFVDLKMDPRDPNVLYAAGWHRIRWGGGKMEGAGAGSGIWKSTDGGDTWTELTAADGAAADARFNDRGLPVRKLGRIGLGVAPSDPDVVYAVIQAAHGAKNPALSPYGGLFRSDDAGETWERVNDLSAIPDYYYNEVWVDPSDADHLYLGQTFLQESKDGGRTIAPVDLGRVHVDHHALWINPDDPDHLVLGNDGGVYISYDGGAAWAHQIIPASQFYEINVDTTKVPYHVCGGTQDNSTWCGPSRTRERIGIPAGEWYKVYGGDGFHSAVSPDDPNIRFAEYQYGNVARLEVDTWEYTRITPHAEDAGAEAGYPFRWDWNTPFIISQHDPTVLYLGGNYLFKLTDRGRDWEILGPDMTRQNRYHPEPDTGHTSYHSLHSVAESPLDADVLWTGSNDGLLWVSFDGGESWRNVTENIPDPSARRCFVGEIEPSHFDARTAYVAYDCHRRDDYRPHVFKTTDGGETWTDISGNLPEDAGSYVVREDAENPNLLFVGNERGLWLSIHGGNDWVRLKNNLPTVPIRDMDYVHRRKEMVVGTYGRSIYILDVEPLQELTDSVLAADAHLFSVKPARSYNRRDTYGEFGDNFFTAPNPPYGATITYYLREDLGTDARLVIREGAPAEADEVAAIDATATPDARPESGAAHAPGAGSAAPMATEAGPVIRTIKASGRPGIHRVVWDLKRNKPRPRRLGDPLSRDELREVLPGTYTVELKVGDRTLRQEIVVKDGWVEQMPGRIR